MKRRTAIFGVVLVILSAFVASGTTIYGVLHDKIALQAAQDEELAQIITPKNLKHTNFATLVASLLQNGAQAGAPNLARIDELFKGIIQEVTVEQLQADEIQHDNEKQCKAETAFRQKEITKASTALNKATEKMSTCKATLTVAEANYASMRQQKNEKKMELKHLTEIRDTQRKRFNQTQLQYQEASKVIGELIKISAKFREAKEKDEKKGKGTTKHSDKLALVETESLRVQSMKLAQHGLVFREHIASFGGVISALVQMTKGGKSSTVHRIRVMLQKLRKDLEESNNKAVTEEIAAEAQFKTDTARLNKALTTLKAFIKDLKKIITANQICIGDASSVIAVESMNVRHHQELLTTTTSMCTKSKTAYDAATKTRSEAQQLYHQILEWLKNYFASH